jgi:tetratricopeptide (TPR) repeat protein
MMDTYDLFISYSRRDNAQGRVTALVRKISRDFESFAGRPLRPFFDVSEIGGMDDWRHRILRGLRESRLLLAILSPTYLKSPYCEWEFNDYLNHEISRGLVGDGIAPIYFVEVDWKEKRSEQQIAEWVEELRRRNSFDLQPWFHQGEEALRDQAVQKRMTDLAKKIQKRIRQGELSENAKGNVDKFNLYFAGRTTEMRQLRESAALKKVGVLTAVQGLGGIGKTALACAYAHTYASEYPGGRWQVKCEGRGDLRAALISLVGVRDFEFEFRDEEKRDPDLSFERVLRELKKRAEAASDPKRVLLILDNVDKPELLAPAQTQRLPAADWLHVIATTRLGEADLGRGPDRCYVAINELPEKDAVALIQKWQPGGSFPNEEERQAAHGLARLLGGFTLAVEAAAVYLGQSAGAVTCVGFKSRLEQEGLGGLEEAVSDPDIRVQHDEKRLSVTLKPTLDRLFTPEKLVLTYAALLPADYVVRPWIRDLVAKEFPELGRDVEPGYRDPWEKLLGSLISLRFLQLTSEFNVVRIHRLVQELVRQQADRVWLDSLDQALIAHVKKRGEVFFTDWANPETRWELEPLAACAGHWMGMELREREGTEIVSSVAARMLRLARHTEAEPLYRRALAIREMSLGPDHPDVAYPLNNLANLLDDTNRRAEAEPLFRRALAILEKSLGPDHPDVAYPLNNLANLFFESNRRAESEPLYRRALAIREESLGPDHPDVAYSLNGLANLLNQTNRRTEAVPLLRRALAIREKSLGPDHLDVARSLTDLATFLFDSNRRAEAEPLLRRALAIREKSLGPDHPDVAYSLNGLANLLNDTNRRTEAEPLFRRTLAIREKSLGPDHPDVARSLTDLATFLFNSDRREEAEPLFRRALAIREESLGPDS